MLPHKSPVNSGVAAAPTETIATNTTKPSRLSISRGWLFAQPFNGNGDCGGDDRSSTKHGWDGLYFEPEDSVVTSRDAESLPVPISSRSDCLGGEIETIHDRM